jgi:alpha-2-macroglobulin
MDLLSRALRIGLLLLVGLGASGCAGPGDATPNALSATDDSLASLRQVIPWTGERSEDWSEFIRLFEEHKIGKMLEEADRLATIFRERGATEGVVQATIAGIILRSMGGKSEEALAHLEQTEFPEDLLAFSILHLHRARLYTEYLRRYSWEIRQREKVMTDKTLTLKQMTLAELAGESNQSYYAVWRLRTQLGELKSKSLEEYISSSTYPRDMRGTLRDASVYLWVEHLRASDRWRPEHSAGVHRVPLPPLLGDAVPKVNPIDAELHPVKRMAWILAEHEAWHRENDRPEAALDAFITRIKLLHSVYKEPTDRALIRRAFADRLDQEKSHAWWTVGMSILAEFTLEHEVPTKFTDALAIIDECLAAPKALETVGGKLCEIVRQRLFQREFNLMGMATDAAQKRSLQVRYKNMKQLHFRAWKIDLPAFMLGQRDYSLLPRRDAIVSLIDGKTPAHSWTVALPETSDLRMHTHWVTPPMTDSGTYIILASESAHGEYDWEDEPTRALLMTVSDVVLTHRPTPKGLEFYVLSGATGEPLADTRVRLYQRSYRAGHSLLSTKTSDDEGRVFFTRKRVRGLFAVADRGDQIAVESDSMYFGRAQQKRPHRRILVYTDRSIYRPDQTLHWKVVSYAGDDDKGDFKVKANHSLTVELRDANFEVVLKREVKTNEFGSAAGTFEIPSGRTLGTWRVLVEKEGSGSSSVKVEEYKRPTFEAKFLKSKAAYRLNEPARFTGEARYYFGLPVTEGSVSWRVVRTRVYPRWWSWYFRGSLNRNEEVIKTGTSPLNAEGQFKINFTPEADERLAQGKGRSVSYRYTISAEVTDEGGETRSASQTERIGFVALDVELETDLGFHRAGAVARITAVRRTLNGAPISGEAEWRLVKLNQPKNVVAPAEIPADLKQGAGNLQFPDDLKRPRWSSDYRGHESVIAGWPDGDRLRSGRVVHDSIRGDAEISLGQLTQGAYRLHYATTDRFGAQFETHKDLVVIGDKTDLSVPVAFKLEKKALVVGETARVLVHSGYRDQVMYLSRWRGSKLQSRRAIRGSQIVEFPINRSDRGGFGLSLTYLRDHQLIALKDTVRVDWKDKALALSFETFRDTLRPGQREVWTVKVASAKSTHAAAEVLAYMYDRSLDLFAHHGAPSPLGSYPRFAYVGDWPSNLGVTRQIHVGRYAYPSAGAPNHQLIPRPNRLRTSLIVGTSGGLMGGLMGGGLGASGYGRGGGGRAAGSGSGAGRFAAMGMMDKEAKVERRGRVHSAKRLEVQMDGLEKEGEEDREENAEETASRALGSIGVLGSPEVVPRSNFSETAFFQPQLRTQPDGTVRIEFEVPDSVTSWNVYAHAITKDLSYGMVKGEVKTVKDLMVRPYLPRFLREGDAATLQVVVNNASDGDLKGTVDFDIIDPESKESRLADFGLTASQAQGIPFTAAKGKSARLSIPVKAPQDLGVVAVKVTARTGEFSDGELRPIPLLPGRVHLAQSRFVVLKDVTKKSVKFDDLAKDDDPTRVDSSMVVTLDGQLFYGVLSALPYLVNYPYECTEQTLNRFLATGILSSLYGDYPAIASMAKTLSKRDTRLERWDDHDPNRKIALEETPWLREARGGGTQDLERVLDPRVAKAQRAAALKTLRKAQTAIGGFPWFAGGAPSPHMTLYLMHGFAKALEFGVDVPKDMARRAWAYLKIHHIDEQIRKILDKKTGGWQTVTSLNYVLSRFPDASWYGGVADDALRTEMLNFSFAHWKDHPPYLKAYLAMTLKKMGRAADAKLVWESVLDMAQETPDKGTFWAPEDRSWLWYNDSIESHAMAIRATMELAPKEPKLDGMVLWLFLNKKLNHWKSTRATSEVIYALAHYLKGTGQLGAREETTVTVGDIEKTYIFEPDVFTGKKNQIVIPGEKISPKSHASVVFDKKSKGYQLASATWHFSTEKMPTEARGDFLGVTRSYYRRVKSGREVTLEPLDEGAQIAVGDEVEVSLSLRSGHQLEYVQLRDPRAAGFEPTSTTSRYKYDLGIGWYEEIRDSATNFFFERLPQGEYTFKYRLRATIAGTFKVGPAVVQPVYAPEFVAYSAGHHLRIASADEP